MLKGKNRMSLTEQMIEIPAEHEANVFGQFDAYVKKLERTFHVTLIARDGNLKIVGEGMPHPDTACGIVQAGQYHYRTECGLCNFSGI